MKHLNPSSNFLPAGIAMAHGVSVEPGHEWLFISGQVGLAPEGHTVDGINAQVEQVWRNIMGVLQAADMGLQHLVKVNAYFTSMEAYKAFGAKRAELFDGIKAPASTGLLVSGFIHPDWHLEVEAIAAKPAG